MSFVTAAEFEKNMGSNLALTAIGVASFICASLRLQVETSLAEEFNYFGWDFFLVLPETFLTFVLAAWGLFGRGEEETVVHQREKYVTFADNELPPSAEMQANIFRFFFEFSKKKNSLTDQVESRSNSCKSC